MRPPPRHGASAHRSGLLGLEGVGYPMATAILDILDPGVWPVMDRWAVMTVRDSAWRPPVAEHPVAARHRVRGLRPAPGYGWRGGVGSQPLGDELHEEAMQLSRNGPPLPARWNHARLPPRA